MNNRRPLTLSFTAKISLALLACGAACNVTLVDGDYRGEALLTLQGQVLLIPAKPDGDKGSGPGGKGQQPPTQVTFPAGQLRLAIVWETTGVEDTSEATMSGLEQSIAVSASFPARYELTLFTPPADEVVHTVDGGDYAIGTIVAYIDVNANRGFDPATDTLVGGAPGRALLYSPTGVQASWLSAKLEAGYHRLHKANDSKQQCAEGGRIQLAEDPAVDTDLQVFESFPKDALLDLDCNGDNKEWRGVCPSKEHLHKLCPKAPSDDWACQNCRR